jgi:hypothetical protein
MNTVQNATGFDEFWEVYPRKVAKGAARQKYVKALKMTTHDEIMAGLDRYVAWLDGQKTQRQYICHASTWLHNERWTDEHEPPKGELPMHAVLRWQERYRRDPKLVPDGIVRMLNLNANST